MEFQLDPVPEFLLRLRERVMMDRAMERPINMDEARYRPRRRIAPVPDRPMTPPRVDVRRVYDD